MATSMALGGSKSMTLGLGSGSPLIGGGVTLNPIGSIGNLTPSHNGIKYCSPGIGSATSSIHSPISTPSSTPNSAIISNSTTSGSIGKCPTSVNNNCTSSNLMNSNLSSGSMSIGNGNSNSDIFGSKCKRKINFSNLGMPGRAHQPATVARRNARERNRVKQVNNGFSALKQHIPLGHRSKKMSKVETLRCAVDYIKNLQGMLNIQGSLGSSSPAGSSISGDIILLDDENQEQQSTQHQQHQQHQMNGVNNQQDAFALSSSSSSSPTSSDFGASVAHIPHHLAILQSHHNLHHQQHLANNNTNNQLRHLSLSHHQLHSTNSVSVATALIVDSNSNAVTPNSNQLSPTSSEDPSSPYTSEASSYLNSNGNIKGGNMPYDYENYEPVSPEDEELLDAIAWWQQS